MKQQVFTDLYFKPRKQLHDSGFHCFKIVGYNRDTKERVVLSKCSDVIEIPQHLNKIYEDSKWKPSILKMDVEKGSEYIHMFLHRKNYRFLVTHTLSDFEFEIIEIKEENNKVPF